MGARVPRMRWRWQRSAPRPTARRPSAPPRPGTACGAAVLALRGVTVLRRSRSGTSRRLRARRRRLRARERWPPRSARRAGGEQGAEDDAGTTGGGIGPASRSREAQAGEPRVTPGHCDGGRRAAPPTKLALTAELVGKSLSPSRRARTATSATPSWRSPTSTSQMKFLRSTQRAQVFGVHAGDVLAGDSARAAHRSALARPERREYKTPEAPAAEPAEGGGGGGRRRGGRRTPAAPPPQIAPWASSFAFPALQVLALKECGLASLAGCAWDLPALREPRPRRQRAADPRRARDPPSSPTSRSKATCRSPTSERWARVPGALVALR